jgi:hypothetical protein
MAAGAAVTSRNAGLVAAGKAIRVGNYAVGGSPETLRVLAQAKENSQGSDRAQSDQNCVLDQILTLFVNYEALQCAHWQPRMSGDCTAMHKA